MFGSLYVVLFAILAAVLSLPSTSIFDANQNLALLPKHGRPHYSGYYTSNTSSNTQMFYSYYEAIDPQRPIIETPIILWLQGGPGCSGGIGNFYELGRWVVGSDLQITENEGTWNRRYGLLFVDSPVGTGFSIAHSIDDIPSDQYGVAQHLHFVLLQFFEDHLSFSGRPFFIAGESYAGKYVPSLAYYIVFESEKKNKNKEFWENPNSDEGQIELPEKENLVNIDSGGRERREKGSGLRLDGIIIGNGFTDPIIQVKAHAEIAYQVGIIDYQQKLEGEEKAQQIVAMIEGGEWEEATVARTEYVDWLQNISGLATLLDFRRHVPYHYRNSTQEYLALFLNQPQIKAALNASSNKEWVSCNPMVRKALKKDIMKSTKWAVEALLPKLPILLYQGLFDLKDGVASSEDWMRTLRWSHTQSFYDTTRQKWYVEGELAGYRRQYSSLSHYILRGAGHEVPADKSTNSQSMVETWIEEQLLSNFE